MHRFHFFVSFYYETPSYRGFKSFTYYTGESFPSLEEMKKYVQGLTSEPILNFVPITIQAITADQYRDYGDN